MVQGVECKRGLVLPLAEHYTDLRGRYKKYIVTGVGIMAAATTDSIARTEAFCLGQQPLEAGSLQNSGDWAIPE